MKKSVLSVLLMVSLLTACNQRKSTADFVSGTHEYEWEDSATYKGEWLNGQPHGEGTMVFENGDKYTGEWKYGEKSGKGVYIFAKTKNKYDGEFKHNVPEGEGVFTFSNGDKYTGEFSANKPNGRGQFIHADGSYEKGVFKDGKLNGNSDCSSMDKSGNIYTGDFVRGMKSGEGKMDYLNGDSYTGDWYNNKAHGYGKYYYANGCRYEGHFANGVASGYGVYTWDDGECYRGEFQNDQMHGQGAIYDAEGNVIESGIYSNGVLVGQLDERRETKDDGSERSERSDDDNYYSEDEIM